MNFFKHSYRVEKKYSRAIWRAYPTTLGIYYEVQKRRWWLPLWLPHWEEGTGPFLHKSQATAWAKRNFK